MGSIHKFLTTLAFSLLLFAGCSGNDVDAGGNDLMLAIEMEPEWDVDNGITSSSQTTHIQVNLNIPTVNWTVESDSKWCRVDSDMIYTGSANIDVVVDANDTFDKRYAVLTFKSGYYSETLQIDQAGNIFILSEVYRVLASDRSETFDVEVAAEVDWEVSAPEWVNVDKVGETTENADGMQSATMRISVGPNPDAAYRYGVIELVPDEGYPGAFYIYQFGSDVLLTETGEMDIAAEGNVSFDVVAPFGIVEAIEAPYWIESTDTVSEDGTSVIYNFWIGRNISDTKSHREAVIEFVIKDREHHVSLPPIRQDYIPAGGIVTGPGLKMFAEAYNAGEDISFWATETSGRVVVNVLSDVHMEELESYTPIGTAERPFDGEFNGNGWLIENWESTTPMFGYTGENADIHNVIINTTGLFRFSGSYSSESYKAPFVGVHRGVLRDCINRAPVSVTAIESIAVMGFGGLVGKLENGRIESCRNEGAVTVTASVSSSKDFYLGGIVARMSGAECVLDNCVNSAAVSDYALVSETSSNVYVAGVAGMAQGRISNCSTGEKPITVATNVSRNIYTGGIAAYSTATLSDCMNYSPISTSLERNGDAVRAEQLGGIVAWQSGDVTNCSNHGALISSSNHKFFFVGGICSSMVDGTMSGVTNYAKIDVMGITNASIAGVRYLTAGGITGALYANARISGSGETIATGTITVMAMESSGASRISTGGIVGQLRGTVENVVSATTVTVPTSFVSTGWTNSTFSFGGIAGIVSEYSLESDAEAKERAHAYITGCDNIAPLTWLRTSPNINSSPVYIGGILGLAAGDVSVTISDCNNTAQISNLHYNNEFLWSKSPNAAGGILGAHEGADQSRCVFIENCSNSGSVNVNRTNAGGIAGYLNYGEIDNCRNTGAYDSGGNDTRRSRNGGIVSEAYHTKITNCVNRAKLYAQFTGGSAPTCGGIAAILGEGSVIDNCRHFGEISAQENSTERYLGGLAGRSEAGTTIGSSGFGGTIDGELVTIDQICSDRNFDVPEGCENYIWDGNEQ